MAPTIAERAANGEVLHAPNLTLQERRDLLVWAREQGMEYKEIKRKYGFHESESTLRGWMRNATHGPTPREATFTTTDDRLLDEGIRRYATGPLHEANSYPSGIWTKVVDHIRKNGGTTSAGPTTLRERWNATRGYNIPPRNSSGGTRGKTGRGSAKSNTPTKPTAPTRSTQTNTSQNRPTSPVLPGPDMMWGHYPALPWNELVDVLGWEGAQMWIRQGGDYEPLSDEEEGDDDVEEEEGEEEEGEEEESEEDEHEDEDEDLHWNHEEYDDSEVEGEDGADFSFGEN